MVRVLQFFLHLEHNSHILCTCVLCGIFCLSECFGLLVDWYVHAYSDTSILRLVLESIRNYTLIQQKFVSVQKIRSMHEYWSLVYVSVFERWCWNIFSRLYIESQYFRDSLTTKCVCIEVSDDMIEALEHHTRT